MLSALKGEGAVREILYKNLTSIKNRRRVISVSEKSENKNYKTRVVKTFIYIMRKQTRVHDSLSEPLLNITKIYDTKTKIEKFSFRVKGILYIAKKDHFEEVVFCHSLRVDIIPKAYSTLA